MNVIKLKSTSDWTHLASEVCILIKNIIPSRKVIILLDGEIGCGKTHLVKLICKILQLKVPITSPTYLFYHEHYCSLLRLNILHIDFYRIHCAHRQWILLLMESLDRAHIVFVEWSKKNILEVQKYFSFWKINVKFLFQADSSLTATIS